MDFQYNPSTSIYSNMSHLCSVLGFIFLSPSWLLLHPTSSLTVQRSVRVILGVCGPKTAYLFDLWFRRVLLPMANLSSLLPNTPNHKSLLSTQLNQHFPLIREHRILIHIFQVFAIQSSFVSLFTCDPNGSSSLTLIVLCYHGLIYWAADFTMYIHSIIITVHSINITIQYFWSWPICVLIMLSRLDTEFWVMHYA